MPRTVRAAALAAFLLVALVDMAGAAAPKPSFGCARAKSAAEKAICADPGLAAALDAGSAKRHDIEQWLFNSVRDRSYDLPVLNMNGAAELAEQLARRDKFLAARDLGPRSGFAGQWGNLGGTLKVTRQPDDRLSAEASAADSYNASWTCGLSRPADVRGDTLVIHDPDVAGGALILRRKGAGAVVEDVSLPDVTRAGASSYCGFNGSLGGTYFPMR